MAPLRAPERLVLPLAAALAVAGLIGAATAQTTVGPPSASPTTPGQTPPPWRNPDLEPQGSTAPPPGTVAPSPAGAATTAPPPRPTLGSVQPVRGQCREFQQDVMIAGERVKAFGTACRQSDGTWKIVR